MTKVLPSVLACLLILDTTTEAQFTSVTIRPSVVARGERSVSRVDTDGGYVATNVTLVQLVEAAYRRSGFDKREVEGGPDWVRTDRFDLSAKNGGGDLVLDADGFPRHSLRMLQELLKERFQLQGGVEARPRQVYALVAVQGGPNVTATTADCAAQMRAFARREQIQGAPCGAAPYPGRLVARGITMWDLAGLIAPWVDRPVIDRTQFTGAFDVDLEGVEIKPAGPFGPSARPSNTTASIFTTIQPQLGVRLEAVTAPVEVLVIRHAERPKP